MPGVGISSCRLIKKGALPRSEGNNAHRGEADDGAAGLKQKIDQTRIATGNKRLTDFEHGRWESR
jgi:hypothetical protein